jgi:Rieske Fe-S protein
MGHTSWKSGISPLQEKSAKNISRNIAFGLFVRKGIYAIFAKCTHLGWTPRWLGTENKFKCPCMAAVFIRTV